jgi:hypothetical protein
MFLGFGIPYLLIQIALISFFMYHVLCLCKHYSSMLWSFFILIEYLHSCIRDELLDANFAENLKCLQNYPIQDVHKILSMAETLQRDDYVPPKERPPRPSEEISQQQWQQRRHEEMFTQTKKRPASQVLLKPEVTRLPIPPKPFDELNAIEENEVQEANQEETSTMSIDAPAVEEKKEQTLPNYKDHPLE